MGGQTKGHNWAPKLTMGYWNFGLGNAHTMYAALVKKFTPDRRALDMPGCVKILTHYLLQRGDSMRTYRPEHPKFSRDLTNVFDFGTGCKICTDAKGIVACGTRGRPTRRSRTNPDVDRPGSSRRRYSCSCASTTRPGRR